VVEMTIGTPLQCVRTLSYTYLPHEAFEGLAELGMVLRHATLAQSSPSSRLLERAINILTEWTHVRASLLSDLLEG
jgi:hypothetical protein